MPLGLYAVLPAQGLSFWAATRVKRAAAVKTGVPRPAPAAKNRRAGAVNRKNRNEIRNSNPQFVPVYRELARDFYCKAAGDVNRHSGPAAQ